MRGDRYASGISQRLERMAMDGQAGHCTRDGFLVPALIVVLFDHWLSVNRVAIDLTPDIFACGKKIVGGPGWI